MGCDIHMRVEYKRKNEGYWRSGEHYQKDVDYGGYEVVDVYHARHYDLFGILAGVRSGTRPIATPKGVPSDATEDTLRDYKYWDGDAHSASWYDYDELKKYYDEKASVEEHEIMEQLMRLLEERLRSLNVWTNSGDTARIIFWFDN